MFFKISLALAVLIIIVSCLKYAIGLRSAVGDKKRGGIDLGILKRIKKNSIRMTYNAISKVECPVGRSKIGGKPDLPEGFQWFYFSEKTCDGARESRPLSFLAQINCEETKPFDTEGLLPSKGMLYFFYELETMTWGFDPDDKGSAKVFYYSGAISDIKRTEFPADLSDEYILPEMTVNFFSQDELPDLEEFDELHSGHDQWDAYDEAKRKIIPLPDEENINKLLGYANLIQGAMLLSCEEVTNGLYMGTDTEIPEAQRKQYEEDCKKWQLLFQLDSIQTDEYEMLWGDLGRIYFYIRGEDLKNLNFGDCWLQLQCS